MTANVSHNRNHLLKNQVQIVSPLEIYVDQKTHNSDSDLSLCLVGHVILV